jgi:hypothetical protein
MLTASWVEVKQKATGADGLSTGDGEVGCRDVCYVPASGDIARHREGIEEAPPGFEPGIADLQDACPPLSLTPIFLLNWSLRQRGSDVPLCVTTCMTQ